MPIRQLKASFTFYPEIQAGKVIDAFFMLRKSKTFLLLTG